ncbi:MAG TPA: GtrA family protein [Clostridia bacterium]|nr:GtrA family protein [Clostridia bacterium]HRX41171.1 GtrA family protein [Clostridia bacterium]
MIDRKKLLAEIFTMIRYGAVGLVNTGVTALVIFLLKLTGIHYALYTLAGYAVGITVSFILNRKFTFKSKERTGLQAMKFLLVTGSLLALTQLLQYLLIDVAGINETIGVILGMVFYTGTGYILNRLFVFKK